MDLWFELLGAWWWVAPTALGAGAAGYGLATSSRRRARRLELDAARHEMSAAYSAMLAARADVRTARAAVQAAQAQRGTAAGGIPPLRRARDELQHAKEVHRAAWLTLRAKRTGVKAARAQLRAHSMSPASDDERLPLARLMARHDVITARWMQYETDAARALAVPQMSDARHPVTAEFLAAEREARAARPASPRAKIGPADYVAYRDAVAAVEATFRVAEQEAWRSARREGPPPVEPPRR